MAGGDSPYKVVEKVGENAYKIELLGDMQISATLMLGISLHSLKMMKNMMKV